MIYIIIILVVLLGILTFALVNSLRKYEILEGELEATDKLIETVYISMQKALLRMTSIDRLGSFEADDESGFIFESGMLLKKKALFSSSTPKLQSQTAKRCQSWTKDR